MAIRCDVCGGNIQRRDPITYWVGPGAITREGHVECAKTAPRGTRAEVATAMMTLLYKVRTKFRYGGGSLRLVKFAKEQYMQEMGVSDDEARAVIDNAVMGTSQQFNRLWREHCVTHGADFDLRILRGHMQELKDEQLKAKFIEEHPERRLYVQDLHGPALRRYIRDS
jgi:hypothetical protein